MNGKYKSSADFVRHEYQLADNDRYYLIQYTGNESAYQSLSHKTSKNSSNTHYRTCPSVIDEIKKEAQNHITAGKIYNKMKSKNVDGEETASGVPKNQSQVKNHVRLERENMRLSHDDIYNTVELHYHLNDYVLQLDMLPSFACVLGLKEVLTDFGNLQQLRRKGKILCSYDTTYNCGDFYVSLIVFKHILFENEPTIPLAFLIHEKRDQEFHERLFQILKKNLPSINRELVVFVVDREPAITNALETMLPNTTVVHCWNHIKRDVRYWLISHKKPNERIPAYINDVDRLLKCSDEDEFAEVLRGRARLGQYHLKDEFLYTCIDVKDLHFPHKYTHPDDIIQQAKRESDRLTKERQVRLEQEEFESDAETDGEDGQSSSGKKQDDDGSVDVGNEDAVEEPKDVKDATLSHFTNVTAVADKSESEKKGKEKNVSQRSLAQAVVDADDIENVPTMNG